MIFYVNLPSPRTGDRSAEGHPGRPAEAALARLDLRGAIVATTSLGAIVFAITQGESAGWTSTQTLLSESVGLRRGSPRSPCSSAHRDPAARDRTARRSRCRGRLLPDARRSRIDLRPLPAQLDVPPERPRDGPLTTGLAFIPLALAAGVGAHAAGHIVSQHGVRGPAHRPSDRSGGDDPRPRRRDGSYLATFSGMLVAGLGLGIAVVSVSIAILTGAREGDGNDLGPQLHRPRDRRHDRRRDLLDDRGRYRGDLAGPQAAAGIAHAFVAAAVLASAASLVALVVLPRGTPLRAQAAAESTRNADSLSQTRATCSSRIGS